MPSSIRLFSLFYLISQALSVALSFMTWDTIIADMTVDFGDSQIAVIVAVAFGGLIYALLLLLWHRVVYRASRAGRRIVVLLAAVSLLVLALPLIIDDRMTVDGYWLDALANLLIIAAATMLFRRDARQWFAHERSVDPDTFS